jgi:hypothetical protein
MKNQSITQRMNDVIHQSTNHSNCRRGSWETSALQKSSSSLGHWSWALHISKGLSVTRGLFNTCCRIAHFSRYFYFQTVSFLIKVKVFSNSSFRLVMKCQFFFGFSFEANFIFQASIHFCSVLNHIHLYNYELPTKPVLTSTCMYIYRLHTNLKQQMVAY